MTSVDGPLPESSHLRQDINIPEQATLEEPDASPVAGTTSSLNAGQHAAGISPVDEYRHSGAAGAERDATEPTAEES